MVPPDSGYGAWGECSTITDSIPHPAWRGRQIFKFSPDTTIEKVPALFFCPGIDAADPRHYRAYTEFLVSNGYSVIYVPYETAIAYLRPPNAYEQMWQGIRAAVEKWGSRIDTTRIGFIGHSFGGGAAFSLSYRALTEKKWGTNGAFLFIMAPWYVYNLSEAELKNYPAGVRMIVQVYEHDDVNDPRIANDIFQTIAIPPSEKDFVILYTDTIGEYILAANHSVPTGTGKYGKGVNCLDYYGVHRLVNALAQYTFYNDSNAKQTALGNGSNRQRFMGCSTGGDSIRFLSAGDRPAMPYPQLYYNNFFSHAINPRARKKVSRSLLSPPSASAPDITMRNYIRYPWYQKMIYDDGEGDNDGGAVHIDTSDRPCLVPPIDSGYGANGPYTAMERFFPHPGKGDANIHVLFPREADTLVPVVLFAPALWKPSTMFYRDLLNHIVSRGNAVVFSTYNYHRLLNQKRRYRVLMEGFAAGLELIIDKIDTTRLTCIGHSYGGGAVPAVAWEYFVNHGWGESAASMFIMAPWYMHGITGEQLRTFPAHVKLIVQVYGGDRRMDRRIAEDIFYAIDIHPDEKDFFVIDDVESEECEIDADHDAPQAEDEDEVNVVDFYGIYKILDALMSYASTGSQQAKDVALGNGSEQQRFMGSWSSGEPVISSMSVTDRPNTTIRQRAFLFRWGSLLNPRRKLYHPDEE
jgi:pimeloyl-ACP methyl ester carboxylesterase